MSRLSRNILYNLVGQCLLLGLGFIAVRYIFKDLGPDALGIIYFTLTMNAVLAGVLDTGISSTLVREVAAHFGDEPRYVSDLVRTASLFYWGAYALLTAAIYCVVPWLVSRWIKLETLDSATAAQALRILGIGALLVVPRSTYASVFAGLQRLEFSNLIDVSTIALQQLGIIFVLRSGGGFLGVAKWLLFCYALAVGAYLLASARFLSWRALIPGFSREAVIRNVHYASRLASTSILAMVQTQADKAILSKQMSISAFGFYGLVYGAASRATRVTSAIAQAAFPSLSSLFQAGGQREGLMWQYRKLQDLVCFALVPVYAAIAFAARPLFTLLFNQEVASLMVVPTIFLCLGFYMNGTCTIPYIFSLAVGKPEIGTRQNFYALFAVLPVTVLLVIYWGLNGAGFSWVVYHLFAYAYGMRRVSVECLRFPARAWYAHVIRILVLAGVTYCPGFLVLEWVGTTSVKFSIAAYCCATVFFLGGAFRLMGCELREHLVGFLKAARVKLVGAF